MAARLFISRISIPSSHPFLEPESNHKSPARCAPCIQWYAENINAVYAENINGTQQKIR